MRKTSPANKTGVAAGTKALLIFLMHQLISTLGIAMLVVFFAYSLLDTLRGLHWQYAQSIWYQIFAYRPYFPVQIVAGFNFGWLLARRLGHRAMIWVWVLPALTLGYALVAIPTLTPDLTSTLLWSGANQSWLTHYFGWGCRLRDNCFDQVLITQPFYIATAYSIGAKLASVSIRPGPKVP